MVAVTGVGADVTELESHGELFSEFPGRFVMATNDAGSFVDRARAAGVEVVTLGTIGGARLRIGGQVDLSVEQIVHRREGALVEALALDA
jgi:hypothetical protein